MRIRRKKHLGDRLVAVKEYLIVPDRDIENVKEAIKNKKYFDYKAIFNNDNPVELEVGCGKGRFIVEKAKANSNVNFIAVELLENIIVMAAELAKQEGLKNVVFVNSGAEYLQRYIPESSIANVYLNFSPPFPKDGYENRRLTSQRYIDAYKIFLVNGGSVYQKTDDKGFFEYSYDMFSKNGFIVTDVTKELNGSMADNIITEYENKFRSANMEIYGLVAKINK